MVDRDDAGRNGPDDSGTGTPDPSSTSDQPAVTPPAGPDQAEVPSAADAPPAGTGEPAVPPSDATVAADSDPADSDPADSDPAEAADAPAEAGALMDEPDPGETQPISPLPPLERTMADGDGIAPVDPADPWANTAEPIEPLDDPGATTVLPPLATGPAGTSMLPRVGGTEEEDSNKWTARAQVRPTDPSDLMVEEEWEEEPRRGGGAGGPILITLAVIVLLGLIGFGIWLMLSGGLGGKDPGVVTTSGPAGSSAPPAPTSAAPTSAAPTSGPAQPEQVNVPRLAGLTYADAEARLAQLGLAASRVERADSTVPAGRVIETLPPAGTKLNKGDTVQVVVSTGAPPEEPPPPTSSEPEEPPPPTSSEPENPPTSAAT